jgi:hypothetical protein
MKLNKYVTAGVIVLAIAFIVGFANVTRENLATRKPTVYTAQAPEGHLVEVRAPEGATIAEITFASYGNPIIDKNDVPKVGSCHRDLRTEVTAACSGREGCGIPVHNIWWGDPCSGTGKKMVIGYTVYDPNAEAKAKEEEEAAAAAKVVADAAAKAKADAKAAAATSTTTPGPADTSTTTPGPADTSKTKSADTPKTKSADTPTTTPEPTAPDNTALYVALGVGALVLVLGVFMIVSRPSPAPVVAGRRRR